MLGYGIWLLSGKIDGSGLLKAGLSSLKKGELGGGASIERIR